MELQGKDTEEVNIKYKNWKGITAIRHIEPIEIWYGETEFHKGYQYFLSALDLDKKEIRDFAMIDILEWDVKKDIKYAAFFGGAKPDQYSEEYYDSVKIGEILAEKGYIVKNGGYQGLMEAVSKGSGNAIGYLCKTFGNGGGNEYLNKTVVTDDIYDRLRYLISDTSLFIIQKGSFGTLAELFLTLDIVRKIKGERPKIILIGDVWRDVIYGIHTLVSDTEIELITIVEDVEELKLIL